jgi:hypothetical protein
LKKLLSEKIDRGPPVAPSYEFIYVLVSVCVCVVERERERERERAREGGRETEI